MVAYSMLWINMSHITKVLLMICCKSFDRLGKLLYAAKAWLIVAEWGKLGYAVLSHFVFVVDGIGRLVLSSFPYTRDPFG